MRTFNDLDNPNIRRATTMTIKRLEALTGNRPITTNKLDEEGRQLIQILGTLVYEVGVEDGKTLARQPK